MDNKNVWSKNSVDVKEQIVTSDYFFFNFFITSADFSLCSYSW